MGRCRDEHPERALGRGGEGVEAEEVAREVGLAGAGRPPYHRERVLGDAPQHAPLLVVEPVPLLPRPLVRRRHPLAELALGPLRRLDHGPPALDGPCGQERPGVVGRRGLAGRGVAEPGERAEQPLGERVRVRAVEDEEPVGTGVEAEHLAELLGGLGPEEDAGLVEAREVEVVDGDLVVLAPVPNELGEERAVDRLEERVGLVLGRDG